MAYEPKYIWNLIDDGEIIDTSTMTRDEAEGRNRDAVDAEETTYWVKASGILVGA